ncbi:peptidoglycan editing factor PgeF [Lentibacillus salicampi]|uniref:Purine nucleoside phosphorylase n=1 Tax=Lentibacillus salicampi TaxID=175306 RepID=A0A4Y9AHY4_9BACI|nr:peptidoglycan editing factor PgeF [Lentibacillus salicampi]TFJ94570.1 peptidoglycan editing factor PgeF [Lentibacillus salicampi]
MTEPFRQLTASTLELGKWQQLRSGLKAGFTTRNGGVSAAPFATLNLGLHVPDYTEDVLANRRKLAEAVHIPMASWVSGEQIHQTNVHIVTDDDKGKGSRQYDTSLKQIDGLMTNRQGILCTAFFADCVPIYFLDPSSGYVGIAHAGWKGTVNRIGRKMVEALQSAGADPADIHVAIGPSISGDAYEVDERVVNHIPDAFFERTVTDQGSNRFLLDLKQLNVEILLQQGVLRHNIDITHYCTFRDETLFFSHRRDQGKTGRMLGYIGYEND